MGEAQCRIRHKVGHALTKGITTTQLLVIIIMWECKPDLNFFSIESRNLIFVEKHCNF